MNKQEGRYIGIDYGSIRCGISISDPLGGMAFPHSVVLNKELEESLVQIVKGSEDKIVAIVLGESKRDEETDNPIMLDIRNFAERIKSRLNIPVEFHSEYLTTAQAKRIGSVDKRDQGTKNEMTDASAATLMLQSFLDKQI